MSTRSPNEPTTAHTPLSEKGVAVRRALLGDAVYDATQRNMTGLDREWQTYVTNQVFGRTWGRGIIGQQQLSLINLAMLAGLQRMEEFELHLRIAVNTTKVPLIQLREIILHISMYCGVPIGRDCFAIARKVFAEEGVDLSELDDQP